MTQLEAGTLQAACPLRPIRNGDELLRAEGVIDALTLRSELSEDEEDYLIVLTLIVQEYGDYHTPPAIRLPETELLALLLKERGLTQRRLCKATGISDSTLSRALSGEARLSRTHIEKLSRYFDISAEEFFPELSPSCSRS